MKFKSSDIRVFNQLFEFKSGYILDFSDRKIDQFFEEELGINIFDEQYQEDGTSKAKRVRCLLRKVDVDTALEILDKLWSHRSIIDSFGKDEDLVAYNALIKSIKSSNVSLSSSLLHEKEFMGIDYTHLTSEMDRIKHLDAHARGYALESWLNELLKVFQMEPRKGFRNTGEQIDGSFKMNGEYYLMEAKWHKNKTPASDLHTFEGKVNQKANWARGVFISWQGFSEDGLVAFGRGHKIVCISGRDMYYCLKSKISFPALLGAKLRHATETGECYIAYEDIKNIY